MRIFTLSLGFMVASLCMASAAEQEGTARAELQAVLDNIESSRMQALDALRAYRNVLELFLRGLGAEQKSVAAWRMQWSREGKTERIARYLTGMSDKARLWYLFPSKADAELMAMFGLGDVRIGHIEHWHWFNMFVDAHNHVRQLIFSQKLKKLKLDIKAARARLAKLNDDLDDMELATATIRAQQQAMRAAVGKMIDTVAAQNIGLQLIVAYQQGMLRGLNNIERDLQSN